MKVLLTGSSGFIGSSIYQELVKQPDMEVITTTRKSDNASENAIYFDFNDRKDYGNLYEYFKKPDMIIHCAWENVRDVYNTDHMEAHLFNQMRFLKNLISNGVKKIIVCGSCFEYGKQYGEMHEDYTDVKPNTGYAIAKNYLRMYLETLQNSYSFALQWIRIFYVYDREGERGGNIITQLKQEVNQGNDTFKMSRGNQLFDYMEIRNLASTFVKIVGQNKIQGIIHCCSGEPKSLIELIEERLSEWDKKITLKKGVYDYRKFESLAIWGNTNKMMDALRAYDAEISG